MGDEANPLLRNRRLLLMAILVVGASLLLLIPYHHVMKAETSIDANHILAANATEYWANNAEILMTSIGKKSGDYQLDIQLVLHWPDEVPYGTTLTEGRTLPRIAEGNHIIFFNYPKQYKSVVVSLWKYSQDDRLMQIDRVDIR